MKKILLLINTLRYLKFKQFVCRAYYFFSKPALKVLEAPSRREELECWQGCSFMEPSTTDGSEFTFLGRAACLTEDWNSPDYAKLWLYNLHYQDILNSFGADQRTELNKCMVNQWIESNPFMIGNGWEPYCISLRSVNWIKWISRLSDDDLDDDWLLSLAQQASALEQQLEYHILANHLFANAKALVFIGSFFGDDLGQRWLDKGLELLDVEIAEQFLSDGAHYELSPMYHSILLWDIADLICLAKNTKLPQLTTRIEHWQKVFREGMNWLQGMCHPDRDISFFNDSTLGIAPTFEDLERYGNELDISLSKPLVSNRIVGNLFEKSGYSVIEWPEGHKLISDVARIGPDYQPGHAHADTLSCELSLFGQRVLVNSGISQYGEDLERHRQRSTCSHNTVEINGKNSSEVWAGFRVAKRAKPFGISLSTSGGDVEMAASHNGYAGLFHKVVHHRHWLVSASEISVTDNILGKVSKATCHWHFHPDVSVKETEGNTFSVSLADGQLIVIVISGAEAQLSKASWHPGFGESVNNYKLECRLSSSSVVTQIRWSCN